MSSILYSELRRQAARCMRGARPGDTLQTTALVHETFMRLAGAHQVDWRDRKHFLAVAGRTMRRLLVDLARTQRSAKRGSRAVHVPLDSGVAASGPPPLDVIALDQALESLAALDARKVQVIELMRPTRWGNKSHRLTAAWRRSGATHGRTHRKREPS